MAQVSVLSGAHPPPLLVTEILALGDEMQALAPWSVLLCLHGRTDSVRAVRIKPKNDNRPKSKQMVSRCANAEHHLIVLEGGRACTQSAPGSEPEVPKIPLGGFLA